MEIKYNLILIMQFLIMWILYKYKYDFNFRILVLLKQNPNNTAITDLKTIRFNNETGALCWVKSQHNVG